MFVIDQQHGERPVCGKCRKPFPATPEETAALRRAYPRTVVVCPGCIIRECGKPETLRREVAVAI